MASLATGGVGHLHLYKKGIKLPSHESRRREMLKRQRMKRMSLLHKARALMGSLNRLQGDQKDTADIEMEYQQTSERENKGRSGRRRRRRFADELVEPEWLLSIPEDLFYNCDEAAGETGMDVSSAEGTERGSMLVSDSEEDEPGWYVLPRPEGKRCLMVAHNGCTVTKDKNGMRVHQFQSILPNGSPMSRTGGGNDAYSIFDCVFNEELCTYIITDLLCWKGQSLYGCTASFRFYWARVRLEETGIGFSSETFLHATGTEMGEENVDGYKIVLAPSFLSTKESVYRCLTDNFGYQTDGVLFVARGGYYEPGEKPSPLMLVWKNENVSRYFCRAKRVSNFPEALGALYDKSLSGPVLSLGVTLKCSDEEEQIMTTREGVQVLCAHTIAYDQAAPVIKESAIATSALRCRTGRLYKFQVFYYRSSTNEELFCGIFRGNGPKRRVHADMHSRIMFHLLAPSLL